MQLKHQIKTPVVTHEALAYHLSPEISNVNAKVSYMVKKGELVRLKKGVYMFSEAYRTKPVDLIAVANMLYTPSYISFEYALSYYGLIPERVYEVTSATLHGKKRFDTPLGYFTYRPVPKKAYSIGLDWIYDSDNGGKLIATPEKALCDKIHSDRGIGRLTQKSLYAYIENDLRIEWESIDAMNHALLRAISEAYGTSNLQTLSKLIAKRRKNV